MRLYDFVVHAAELVPIMTGDETITICGDDLDKEIIVHVSVDKVKILSCWEGAREVEKPHWAADLEEIILKLAREQAAHIYAEKAENDRIEYERKCREFQDRLTNWSGSMAGH